jgi:hypothetical protein
MNGFTLRSLPVSARVLLTCFLALIGTGYLFALGQIFSAHENRDGKKGLTFDDLRAAFHGLTVDASAADSDRPVPSRMLEMIEGEMRQYFKAEEEFKVLHDWLAAGAAQAAFAAGETRRMPADVIRRRCLKCHAAKDGEDIGQKSPFGPDLFTPDFQMVSRFTNAQSADASPGRIRIQPTSVPRLIMLTHAHMLAIPVFTVIVGMLFVTTRFPAGLKGIVTVVPMIAVMIDIGGWWAARWWEPALYGIACSGAAFGACFAIQLLWVTGAMWAGRKA